MALIQNLKSNRVEMRNSFLFNKDIPIDSAYYYVREIAKAMTPSIWGKLSKPILAGILLAIFVNADTVVSATGQARAAISLSCKLSY